MLGFASLSETPLAAVGGAGQIYNTTVADAASALASFIVSSAVFGSNVTTAVDAASTAAAQIVFASQINETAANSASVTVLPSVFGAQIEEELLAFEELVTSFVFFATITGGASAVEQLFARFLWEPIDNAQTVTWNNINNSQADTWSAINNSQTGSWQPVSTQT